VFVRDALRLPRSRTCAGCASRPSSRRGPRSASTPARRSWLRLGTASAACAHPSRSSTRSDQAPGHERWLGAVKVAALPELAGRCRARKAAAAVRERPQEQPGGALRRAGAAPRRALRCAWQADFAAEVSVLTRRALLHAGQRARLRGAARPRKGIGPCADAAVVTGLRTRARAGRCWARSRAR